MAPDIPPSPPPPIAPTFADASRAGQARRQRRAPAGGTIMTSPQGDLSAPNLAFKSLLGNA